MGKRSKRAVRCVSCRLHVESCVCADVPCVQTTTRVVLVMHHRERSKATATGPLALACLPNSELVLHGRAQEPLDLSHLHAEGRRVLVLFPVEGARPLSRELIAEDPRPITLVVPDGNWRQARRIPKRVQGLSQAECVGLPAGPPSAWGVRYEPLAGGLATFEAIARAIGILESAQSQARMETVFGQMVAATLAARGRQEAENDACAQPAERQLETEAAPLKIIHRDAYLVVVNKPAGMPSHRGWARDARPALQRVRDQLGQPVFPVHRLDRATSGLLVFALSSEVARDMQSVLAAAETRKCYLALCRGRDAQLRHIDHPLAKEPDAPKRDAVTEVRLVGSFERYGLYEAMPKTGRTHQIRRHLKHVSHPIIGDVRYGKGEHNRIFRERFAFNRLALHCHRMAFQHPRTGEPVTLCAPLDGPFTQLLLEIGLLPQVPTEVA